MRKRFILLLTSCILLQGICYCASKTTITCLDEGYRAGLLYYKTGDKSYVKPTTGCNMNNSWQLRAYLAGAGYVLQYGETKSSDYYQLERMLRLQELHDTPENAAREAKLKADEIRQIQEMDAIDKKEMQDFCNTYNIPVSQMPKYVDAESQMYWMNQRDKSTQSSQVGETIINTGVQVLRNLVGF